MKIDRWRIRRWWSRVRWGVPVPPSILPMFGKGKFVSVRRRGPYLDIIDHRSFGMVRLIPYQPNHGVMVEYWQGGALHSRTHLDFNGLKEIGRWGAESNQESDPASSPPYPMPYGTGGNLSEQFPATGEES